MFKSVAVTSVFLCALFGLPKFSAVDAQQPPSDWLIVPGERVGAINANTSEKMLETQFGSDNIEPVDVYLGEGFTEPGTAVFPNEESKRIEVVWRDDSRTVPKEVRLTGRTSEWRTKGGLSLGSTLKEIEMLNGYPFRLAGFAFDYSGTIGDCGRGKLTMLGCIDRDNPQRGLQGRLIVVRLSPDLAARQRMEYRQVQGGKFFSSGHPAMQILNPRVYQLIVTLER